jgi:hypothetical protein
MLYILFFILRCLIILDKIIYKFSTNKPKGLKAGFLVKHYSQKTIQISLPLLKQIVKNIKLPTMNHL